MDKCVLGRDYVCLHREVLPSFEMLTPENPFFFPSQWSCVYPWADYYSQMFTTKQNKSQAWRTRSANCFAVVGEKCTVNNCPGINAGCRSHGKWKHSGADAHSLEAPPGHPLLGSFLQSESRSDAPLRTQVQMQHYTQLALVGEYFPFYTMDLGLGWLSTKLP